MIIFFINFMGCPKFQIYVDNCTSRRIVGSIKGNV